MTRQEAGWLAASMKSKTWPEVWVEPGVYSGDWRVAFRRLPNESPRHAANLSKAMKDRCYSDLARGVSLPPVEVLTRTEAAGRARLRLSIPAPVFQGEPLADSEALYRTSLPCPRCEDEGRSTLVMQTPRLYRRENGDFVCPSHGDLYADILDALNTGRDEQADH